MKRMRLPNGFGQISKLNQRLRKPWRVMITIGKTPEGKPICKLLKPEAYFATYNDAYMALMKYHEHPYSYEASQVTFKELYERWLDEYSQTANIKTYHSVTLVEKYLGPLMYKTISEINSNDVRTALKQADSYYYKKRIKFTVSQVFDKANEYEITDKNPAKNIKLSKPTEGIKYPHKVIPKSVLQELWKEDTQISKLILIQCYTGFRPTELCLIKRSDIDFENWLVVGGIKTDAGRDRIVPIHSKIRGLVQEVCGEYLCDGLKYQTYRQLFEERLPDHLPHDPRKTFVTMAKKAKVDEYAIKRIVGHRIKDLTEETYTERDVEWLREEMEKIKDDV